MKQFLKICFLLLLVNSAAEAQFKRFPDGWYYTEPGLFGPVTPVKSVAGKTGVITLTAGDIQTNSQQLFVTQAQIDRWDSYSSVTGITPGLGSDAVHAITDPLSQSLTNAIYALGTKVDAVLGKGLSTNDFSNEYKNKLDGLFVPTLSNLGGVDLAGVHAVTDPLSQAITTQGNTITLKVDKVAGKDLSTNDFSNTYKNKLDGLSNQSGLDATGVNTLVGPQLASKVDKVTGKDLSTNDYTTAEKNKLSQIPGNTQAQLNGKADSTKIKDYYFGTDFVGGLTESDKGRLSNTGVVAGTYGSATQTPVIVVDAKGRILGVTLVTTQGSGSGTQFSGSYLDLTNKPALFSGSYVDLTNKPALFSGAYDALSGKPVIPSTTGGLVNNSGFITRAAIGDSTLSLDPGPGISMTMSADKKKLTIGATATGGTSVTVDQTYGPTSANPQSGSAVAQGLLALGNTKAPLSHTHVPADITGLTAFVNNLIDSYMTAIPGNTSTGDITLTKHNGANLWVTSPTGTTTATATTQLATPSPLSLTATSSTNIAASWPAVTNATGYILQRASSNTFSDATTSYSGSNTSAPGSNTLTAGTTYYYRVQATTTTAGYTSSGYATASVTTPAASTTATAPSSTTGLLAGSPFTNWNLNANSSNAAGITNTNSVTATSDSYIVGNARSVAGATETIIQMDCSDGVATGDLAYGKGTVWAAGNGFTISIAKSADNKIFVRSGTSYLKQPVVTGASALRLRKKPRTDGVAGDVIYAEYWKSGAWVTLDSSVTTTVDEYVKGSLGVGFSLINIQASGLTN